MKKERKDNGRPKELYVVTKGTKTGIFDSWDDELGAKQYVQGVSNAQYRGKFYTLIDAVKYYQDITNDHPVIYLSQDDNVNSDLDLEVKGVVYSTYVLTHPVTHIPFYVGQTKNAKKRKATHLGKQKKDSINKTRSYLFRLQQQGLTPEFHILEDCKTLRSSLASEYKWVRHYLDRGYKLTNSWAEHLPNSVNNVKQSSQALTTPSIPMKPYQAADSYKEFTVFLICDPRTNEPFFIGFSKQFDKRKDSYIHNVTAESKGNVKLYIWSMMKEGCVPEFVVVDRCEEVEIARTKRQKWVEHYVNRGCVIINYDEIMNGKMSNTSQK